MPYLYPAGLALISLAVALAERLRPWRPRQHFLRPHLGADLLHLVFNGHFLGVILYGIAVRYALPPLDRLLLELDLHALLYRNAAASWPLWVQIPVALLVIDLMQYGVHRLLHRVPFLWAMHQTHHSVPDGEMDWVVAFRFQWTEVVVYKVLQYAPLAFLGFAPATVMTHALFGTLIGHLNHSNLFLDYGPLRYVLNNPRMHLHHHDRARDARTGCNYGIIFSTWDYLFGTADVPEHPPKALGFEGDERFPRSFLTQQAWPLPALLPPTPAGRTIAATAAAALLTLGWLLATR